MEDKESPGMESFEIESEIEKSKKRCFSFSKLNHYFLIPFLSPIFSVLLEIFEDLLNYKTTEIKDYVSLNILIPPIYILGGLLYFILRKKKRKINFVINEENTSKNPSIEFIFKENEYTFKSDYKLYIFLLLATLLISISTVLSEYFNPWATIIEQRIYSLIAIPLLCKAFLKEEIYKHQKLSLSLSLFGLILTAIPIIPFFQAQYIINNIYAFFEEITFSLFIILLKYLMDIYYASPFALLFYIGIGYTIILTAYKIIISYIKYKNLFLITNLFTYFYFEISIILYAFIIFFSIIFLFINNILIFLTIYFFSPTLYLITEIICPFLLLFYKIFLYKNLTIENIILFFIGYLIALICILIFNEIIICNFCGLNKNTRKFINLRQKEELTTLFRTSNVSNLSDSSQ